MKIECSQTQLAQSIGKAEKITGKNSTLPVLSCVLLEAKGSSLIIRSTNLDLGIEITIPVKVQKEGVVAVPGNLLVSYVSNVQDEGPITLESNDGVLLITTKTKETQIKTLSSDDFPVIPRIDEGKSFKIESAELVSGFKSVWYSASVSTMKPELSSVYMYADNGIITFVATDSFRLAEKRIKVKQTGDLEAVLIPYRNVSEIVRILDSTSSVVDVHFDNNQISFSFENTYIISRIVDGVFPDYKQIIPKICTTEAIILKQDLVQALKLSNIFSDSFNQVTFSVRPEDKILEITSKNIDKGEHHNTIESSLEGDSLEIRFNQKYITDCFNSINSDSLSLKFDGVTKPMIIKGSKDEGFLYLVMPMNK